jgi:hypothetical protein
MRSTIQLLGNEQEQRNFTIESIEVNRGEGEGPMGIEWIGYGILQSG